MREVSKALSMSEAGTPWLINLAKPFCWSWDTSFLQKTVRMVGLGLWKREKSSWEEVMVVMVAVHEGKGRELRSIWGEAEKLEDETSDGEGEREIKTDEA